MWPSNRERRSSQEFAKAGRSRPDAGHVIGIDNDLEIESLPELDAIAGTMDGEA